MSALLQDALALLEHAASGQGNVELDSVQATALLVDRRALWSDAKRLKASEGRLVEALKHALEAIPYATSAAHDGDEETGEHYPECVGCAFEGARAHIEDALAKVNP